jgi:hypothetical protein
MRSLLNVDVLSGTWSRSAFNIGISPRRQKGEIEEAESEEGAAVNYVTKIMKNRLWESLIPHFTLPATETWNSQSNRRIKSGSGLSRR